MLQVLSFLSFILERCSPRILWVLASFLSSFLWFLNIRKRIVIYNIKQAYKNSLSFFEIKKIARKSYFYTVLTYLEFLASNRLFPKMKINFKNDSFLKECFEKKQGVYILCLHQSNWELMCYAGSKKYQPIKVAVKKIGSPKVFQWILNKRHQNGLFEIPRDEQVPAWQQINTLIEGGGWVAFMVDQHRKKGVEAPLFRKKVLTNASIFRQYWGIPAPVVPVCLTRNSPNEVTLEALEPLCVVKDHFKNEEEFLKYYAEEMNKVVEKMILKNPQEYYWMHNRFKI